MYTLYKVNNNKKSGIRGFWLDKNKLYVDNIFQVNYKTKKSLLQDVKSLFRKDEKAVFYKQGKTAFIIGKNGVLRRFKQRLILHRVKLTPSEFKRLLWPTKSR